MQKYQLVSILIHDGVAGSGHYYSFIRDVETDTWKRYNDIQVSDEKEDVVMKEAFGGYNNVNAYCLVYSNQKACDEDIKTKQLYMNNKIFIEDKEIGIPKQHYASLLTDNLKLEVIFKNFYI